MDRLIAITHPDDIVPAYRNSPIGKLLEYHNFGRAEDVYDSAELLIGMCMDNRKKLRIPENFAFIIRTGGGNLRYSEFKVSYAISVGGIRHIVLMGHNNCGMVNLPSKRDVFIEGLKEIGWDESSATDHFNHFAPLFGIDNEIDFVLQEARRLRLRYPGICVVPMHYNVDDNRLSLVRED